MAANVLRHAQNGHFGVSNILQVCFLILYYYLN
jgi:hypothetical protein